MVVLLRCCGPPNSFLKPLRPHKGPTNLNPHGYILMNTQTKITIGSVFKRLTVVGISLVYENGKSRTKYRCRCECGNYSNTTAVRLREGQISCGCARGGVKGQRNNSKKAPTGYRNWTPEIGAEVERLHSEGYGTGSIAKKLFISKHSARQHLIGCGRLENIEAMPKPEKPKAEWPAGLRFEDMPADILAREPKGKPIRAVMNYSAMGCSAQMCVGGY